MVLLGGISDKGIIVWKNHDEGHSVYPEEMVPDLVLAKHSKSLGRNNVVFKPFYFFFFHLFCNTEIWFPYVTALDIDAPWAAPGWSVPKGQFKFEN